MNTANKLCTKTRDFSIAPMSTINRLIYLFQPIASDINNIALSQNYSKFLWDHKKSKEGRSLTGRTKSKYSVNPCNAVDTREGRRRIISPFDSFFRSNNVHLEVPPTVVSFIITIMKMPTNIWVRIKENIDLSLAKRFISFSAKGFILFSHWKHHPSLVQYL